MIDIKEFLEVKEVMKKKYNKSILLSDIRCVNIKNLKYTCKDYPIKIYIIIDISGEIYIVKKYATGELKAKII